MKTKLARISKRSLAMILSILMIVSAFFVMGTVTVSAAYSNYYLKGTEVGSTWDAQSNGIHFSSSGYATFTTTKKNAKYKLWRNDWGNDGWFGSGSTISSTDTEFTIYQNGADGYIGLDAGKYSMQLTSEGTQTKAKIFPVITLSEETVLYFKLSKWWSNTGCYEYARFMKPDGTSTAYLPMYNLAKYKADNSDLSTAGSGSDNTIYFCTLPAGDYIGINGLARKSSDSGSGGNYNEKTMLSYLHLSKNINTTAFTSDSSSFSFDAAYDATNVAPTLTVKANSSSSDISVNQGTSVTLSNSSTNGALVTGSVTYSGTGVSGSTFSNSTPGQYTITGTYSYHEKGFSSLSGTATDTIKISVNPKLTFNSKGGSSVATQNVTYNSAPTKPADPTREGYDFAGWVTTDGGSTAFNFSTAMTTNKTAYAKWTQKTYAITLSESGASGGTMQVDSAAFTSGSTVTHGSHTFRVDAPSGYVIDSISGIGTWTNNGSYATLGSTSITAAETISVTYVADGRPSLDEIADQSKTVNNTTFNVSATISDEDKKSDTLTVDLSSGTTTVATVGSATVSGSTVTIPVTVKGPGTSTITATLKDGSTTLNSQTFDVTVAEPTLSLAAKTITVNDTGVAAPTLTASPAASSHTWSSGTTSKVTINSSTGALTGKEPGKSTITYAATYACGYTKNATCTVTVSEPTFTLTDIAMYTTTKNSAITKSTSPTPSSISWSSDNTTYITVNSSGEVTAVKTPSGTTNQTATITATATYANGYTKTATCTATLNYPRLEVSATSTSGNIGDTTTAQISALSYPGQGTTNISNYVTGYSWSTSDSNVVSLSSTTAASPTLTFKKTGTATISLEVTYKNTGLKKTNTNTLTITVNAPTVSFSNATDASINVGGSVTRTATGSAPTGGTITYSGSNQYIDVNSSTGAVTGLKPTSSAQAVTATYTVTYSGQTSTATATYNVTVKTPSVSASAMTVAVDDSKQLTPSTTNATGVTYTYSSSDPAICTVDGDGWVKGINAGTATVTVTAVCRDWSGTATSAITVEAPSLTIADTANASTKYITVGTNYTKALSNNFGATSYTVTSSNTSVATASESSGTLTVVPVAKGTSTITVTASKSVTRASTITDTQTFTVNVAEADNYKYLYFENGVNYNPPKAYLWNSSNTSVNNSWPGEAMVKIGTNSLNKDIYAIRYDPSKGYDRLIITNNGVDSTKIKENNTTDIVIPSDKNTIWSDNKDSNGGWYNSTVVKPQITVNNIADLPVTTSGTLTATLVNDSSPSEYKWIEDGTTKLTIANSGSTTTNSNTVTAKNSTGTVNVNVKAYCALPVFNGTALSSIVTDGTADDYLAGTATASVTITADPRTVSWANLLSKDGTNYNEANPSAAGSITATNGPASSGGTVAHGTAVTFHATANAGYKHVGWKVDDGAITKTTSDKTVTVTANTTVYAVFDKIYTTTISKGANGAVKNSAGSANFTGEDVIWNNTPATMKVTPSTGYMIDYANCTNLSKFYTVDTSATTGTVTITGKTVAEADKANTTITIAFKAITPVINYTAKKTDDGTTLSNGGGTITAKEIHYTAGTSGTGTPSYYYLWWGNLDNPTNYNNKVNAVKGTDNCYYASFQTSSNFFFSITTSNSSATASTQKINSSTTADVGSGFASWTCRSNYTETYIGKGHLDSGDTIYIKLDESANKIYFRNTEFTYTIAYSGGSGGTPASETEVKTLSASGDTITYNNRVYFTANANTDYKFEGWYSDASCTTLLSTDRTYKTTDITAASYSIYAKFKKMSFITLYNSYMYQNGDWTFVASPPRRVEIGDGSTKRTYVYDTGAGNQRGEEFVLDGGGTYYEGNKLVVYPGEKIKLTFSTLASSDAIKGVFFNNNRRYTTEQEDNNLYYLREYKAGGWGDREHGYNGGLTGEGESVPDDDWDYTFNADTTIYADAGYYTDKAVTIATQEANYAANKTGGAVDQVDHTVEWIAEGSYLNIDVELDYKYQLHINDDDWNGLKIENMNDEGYYYRGEDFDSNFKISIEQPTDGSGTYSFTDYNVAYTDKDGNPVSQPTGMAVVAKQSGGANATSASNVSYFLVTGAMPGQNVYIQLPITKKYKMRLSNVVVSDAIDNKVMLNQTNGTSYTSGSTGESSGTGHIGTVSAIVNDGSSTNIAYENNSTYHWYYPTGGTVVEDNQYSNNYYLKRGGVNKAGSDVEEGKKVTYTFTFANGMDTKYSFVGWYEGTLSGSTFTPDYSKKLSGKTSFTYTPKKDTVVIAVGTRDMYIGGNFTSEGAYSTTNTTWSSGRIRMDFDPTYVNPSDSSKKGRYYYTFDTVNANTEYQFRCYDTSSGTATTNLSVWSSWSGSDYANDPDDVFFGRHKYAAADGYSHGQFVYKTNTNNWSLIDNTASDHDSNKNHQANGYAAPVEVYFYAYDGGISVNSTYQWSKAYVSAGCGIDVVNPDASSGKYNTPTVSVASKTVNNKDVTGYNTEVAYGNEGIYECTVKEKDGQIRVTANPNDNHLAVQAFLIYNIDTKESEAIKVESSGGAVTQNITVPQNSKLYIVPIYKFTDAYIESAGLETHTVYVRADEIDKDDWGGLVSMYSWGTDSRYDSGGWPGQLMIPSDDGSSFYAPLTFSANGLAGVTFSNYTQVWGGNFVNFLGLYQSRGVSDTVYSSYTNTSTHYINQVYDYREPISIIENINEGGIYDSEDMDLTFALKQGNKNGTNFGAGTYSASYDWEYLTDRSGKKRVDLNGNALSTNSTATYYVVCSYTRDYVSGGSKNYDFVDGDRDGTTTHNCYSIEWTVYDQEHTKIGSEKLSAAFTDIYKSEMLTYIAKMLDNYGYPVSGKAVQIAYEDPKESLKNEDNQNTEAKRFSGQWYADGVNSLIEGNVRVGIYSDGAWTPSDTNAPGYATATVGVKSGAGFTIPNSTTGEQYVQEDGCSGNSLVKVTKKHATDGNITYTVSTTDNFLGWYRDDGEGGFEPVGSNYKNQTITPSFNSDITLYAFYSASASYRFAYTSRKGTTKYYTAKGTDLTTEELANGGTLNPTTRSSDITSKLSGITGIKVFNHDLTYSLTSPDTSSPYTITYTAGDTASTYTLTVMAYNSSGTLTTVGSKTGTWNTSLDVNNDLTSYASGFTKGSKLVNNKPSDHGNYIFLGWRKYNGSAFEGPVLSTKENFGYSITSDTTIAPFFVDPTESTTINQYISETWNPGIDNSVVTQELTSSTEGIVYNDNLISFRYGSDTNKRIDGSSIYNTSPNTVPEGKQCGVVVLAQANDATDGQKTTFNNQYSADSHVQSSVNYFVTGAGTEKSSVKLSSSKYGDAYAFHVKAETLSNLNRANIVQALDYAKFSGGNYKVMSYYYDGSTIVYSNITSGTLTCS